MGGRAKGLRDYNPPPPSQFIFKFKKKNNKKIPERDYFKVQIPSGLWIWIYREINTASKHQWFVHGVWS